MQIEFFLGNADNLRMIILGVQTSSLNLGRWKKALCLKIGKNEVFTNE